MEETKLRQLEQRYKLRVKTGCGTCRFRKVKCDETKPACLRCTKTGRKCDGYNNQIKPKTGHAAAASFRNSSFLVVPQTVIQPTITRSVSANSNLDPRESRSFQYFQVHTLPNWTEFFDCELWSRTILQMSHAEPAIKHGLLALSVMHERYEHNSPIFTTSFDDFAFVQYTRAVKHSNELLKAHQAGKVSLEMVLIACIIFTCYENLAGNFKIADMHLRNGLRIMDQFKKEGKGHLSPSFDTIGSVLRRFDLQAMTFSDNCSRYDYSIETPPDCPQVSHKYTSNEVARDDLVGLLRCLMWAAGTVDNDITVYTHPTWQRVNAEMIVAYEQWEKRFAGYQNGCSPQELSDPKIYAGNTLLKMCAMIVRIFAATEGGPQTETDWDMFLEPFKTIVDLAETLPIWRSPNMQSRSPSPAPSSQGRLQQTSPNPSRNRPIAPSPWTTSPSPTSGTNTFVFSQDSMTPPPPATSSSSPIPSSLPTEFPNPTTQPPTFFSPSFELSPIVPLFLVACRCRDPLTRRRALHLLLRSRRREGVWDSFAAGMVAAQCMRKEENLAPGANFGDADFLALSPSVREASDVPEWRRVRNIFVEVKVVEGRIELVYSTTVGVALEQEIVYESWGDDGGSAAGGRAGR